MELNHPLARSFQDKKVFITGHTGFKGAWLVSILTEMGAKIKGYALQPEDPSLYQTIRGDSLCESVLADIRNFERLKQEILNFSPDYIFHLAAQPLVLDSYDRPLYTYEVNTIGTVNLLTACKDLKKPCAAIIVTTDKVYANDDSKTLFKEEDPLGGHDPYSSSKAAADIATASFTRSFFNDHPVRIAIARAGNVIGSGDNSKNRIIPDLMNALLSDKKLSIRNPNSVRPWQHVLDCLNGYLMLAERIYKDVNFYKQHHMAWNFGPENSDCLTVLELVQLAIKFYGTGKYKIEESSESPHEAGYLQLSSEKSKTNLSWKQQWDAKTAIEHTVKDYFSGPVAIKKQIRNFFS